MSLPEEIAGAVKKGVLDLGAPAVVPPQAEPPPATVAVLAVLTARDQNNTRRRLRAHYNRFMAALDETPRDQKRVEQLRRLLPRPVSDRDFWELALR